MSTKAARGTKRTCLGCGNKFYDLNRDPITCPICSAVFRHQETRQKAATPVVDDEDDEVLTPAPASVETVSLDEVAAEEDEIPDLEDGDIDIDDEDADIGDSDEPFMEVEEDDDDNDVTGIVGGSREDDEDA